MLTMVIHRRPRRPSLPPSPRPNGRLRSDHTNIGKRRDYQDSFVVNLCRVKGLSCPQASYFIRSHYFISANTSLRRRPLSALVCNRIEHSIRYISHVDITSANTSPARSATSPSQHHHRQRPSSSSLLYQGSRIHALEPYFHETSSSASYGDR
ncbi:hypothetical protein BJ165DRAFT_1479033 [Panaeolus papilionaceus]|nr:hypothetical protein BJ165DRAFT_1479033 [Panaeolus papilionaceus]